MDTKPSPPYRSPNDFGGRSNEAWADQKEGFYYTVADSMLKTGFTEEEIGKIGGANYCRVFDINSPKYLSK